MLSTTARRAARNIAGRRYASAIASKYSQAAFGAALSKSPQVLSKVQSELAAISTAISNTLELSSFVHNPSLTSKDRTKGLDALFNVADKSGKTSDVTRNLFSVLAENGRLAETTGVIEGFNELLAKHRGELDVVITSAQPLAKDQLSKLESTLKQSQAAQAAKTLKVTNKVNPALLGGLVVDFGDKTIDLSVSSRVTRLNSMLQQSV